MERYNGGNVVSVKRSIACLEDEDSAEAKKIRTESSHINPKGTCDTVFTRVRETTGQPISIDQDCGTTFECHNLWSEVWQDDRAQADAMDWISQDAYEVTFASTIHEMKADCIQDWQSRFVNGLEDTSTTYQPLVHHEFSTSWPQEYSRGSELEWSYNSSNQPATSSAEEVIDAAPPIELSSDSHSRNSDHNNVEGKHDMIQENEPHMIDDQYWMNEPQQEICFGALIEPIKTSIILEKDKDQVEIDIQPFDRILSLRTKDTGKYVGLLINETLAGLLDKGKVTIHATLKRAEAKSKQQAARARKPEPKRNAYLARMIVYGLVTEKDVIANTLSNADLYLQQPSRDECDRDRVYDNPQYLVRPGRQMPMLNSSSSISSDCIDAKAAQLNETKKNQILRLFDLTGDVPFSATTSASPRLATVLKEHQQTAVAFMIEKESGLISDPKFPPLWKRTKDAAQFRRYRHAVTGVYEDDPRPACGGILADEMGLGKSLSVLALICASLDAVERFKISTSEAKRAQSITTLVVTPKSTIPGWQSQIERHVHSGCLTVCLYHGPNRRSMAKSFGKYNVIITTYETLRSEYDTRGPLISERWHRTVLDEAHHIRNRSSQLFSAACALQSQYRWCLTGTPIHNSLEDFGSLLSFIRIAPFLSKSAFNLWISSAVNNDRDEGFSRLRKIIATTCLRRTKTMVSGSCQLPPRVEREQRVNLTPEDRMLYEFFRRQTAEIASAAGEPSSSLEDVTRRQGRPKIIALINVLRLICNSGEKLLPATAIKSWQDRDIATINWQSVQEIATCRICGAEIDDCNQQTPGSSPTFIDSGICSDCAVDPMIEENSSPISSSIEQGTPSDVLTKQPRPGPLYESAKLQALLENLSNLRRKENGSDLSRPAKSVIFSFWTKMLDLIQQALRTHGFNFQRVDGQTSLEARSRAIHAFNSEPTCTIMLASIGSTGEGVDLKIANNVHIMEPQWNPMVEAQAVDRVHRIGQDREVSVTRYVVQDSIETYVRWLQQDKIRLIHRSMDTATAQQQQDINEERWNKLRDALR